MWSPLRCPLTPSVSLLGHHHHHPVYGDVHSAEVRVAAFIEQTKTGTRLLGDRRQGLHRPVKSK